MIAPILCWILQDLAQVFMMGIMLVPELFLLVSIFCMVRGDLSEGSVSRWIWAAFAGGLVWDLRWASLPGLSALVYTLCMVCSYIFWIRTPTGGRSAALYAFIAGMAHVISGAVHYLVWAAPSQAATRMFVIQQLSALPALAILCVIYAYRSAKDHV